jgi:outer membrane protein OmpA-like peptidoglycan-associated protein
LMNSADRQATQRHSDRKQLIATSRLTVQTAEDARTISVKRIEEVRRASERQASTNAQERLQSQADDANRMKEKAESDTANAQANAANARANEASARTDAASAQADANNARASEATARNDAANAQAAMITSQDASSVAVTAAQADADQSRLIAQQAQQNEHDANAQKAIIRAQLSVQLNKILETKDSARGLIVSMSDVLFDSGMYSLKPGAREKLSKVSGILLAYPTLSIQVGGYTDNVGGDEMNQKLSENRASTVRDYMVEQGVAASSVTARGFGNTMPVASNDNAAGRQENRRVELVVSGEAIGIPVNATVGSLR